MPIENQTLSEIKEVCTALSDFTEARLKGDKDLILTVTKIEGREVLQTTRVSKMSTFGYLVRWFGFGGSTLTAVGRFLEQHEPQLPKSYSELKEMKISKEEYEDLKLKKSRGCEIFKRCLVDHNKRSSYFPVYVCLQEREKIDLKSWVYHSSAGLTYIEPQPMGLLPGEEESQQIHRYHPPIIDSNKFQFMDPFFTEHRRDFEIRPSTKGFCYEYGLGVEKDEKKAMELYQKATEESKDNEKIHSYSAHYNLGRLYLKNNDINEAIASLGEAEKILLQKIDAAKQSRGSMVEQQKEVEKALPERPGFEPLISDIKNKIHVLDSWIKSWSEDLSKVYTVLAKAHENAPEKQKDYLKKAEALSPQEA